MCVTTLSKCYYGTFNGQFPFPLPVGTVTVRIQYLTEHMKKNRKDKSCLRSLIQLVQRRTKLLKVLKDTDTDKYYDIIKELGLREPVVRKYLQKQRKKK